MAQSIITLSCPSCGANLELKPEVEQMTCAFCGKALFVNRGDDTLSLDPDEQRSDRAGTVTQREQTPKPEFVQEDPRVRQRLADQSLLPQVEQQRIAAEEIVAQDSLRLSRLRTSAYNKRFFGFAAIGCALLFGACAMISILDSISKGFQGTWSPSHVITQVLFDLCLAGIVLALGSFTLWISRSAARRQSARIQPLESQAQVTKSELERLREQEADMRRRLAG